MVETNDAWITERTGIKERRILKGKDQGLSVMAIEAVSGLLKKRGIGPEEIDLMIVATVTPDRVFPATANIVCDAIGQGTRGASTWVQRAVVSSMRLPREPSSLRQEGTGRWWWWAATR
jgi:3-oxoacyl-[acyl-carrier-protein] synthase III